MHTNVKRTSDVDDVNATVGPAKDVHTEVLGVRGADKGWEGATAQPNVREWQAVQHLSSGIEQLQSHTKASKAASRKGMDTTGWWRAQPITQEQVVPGAPVWGTRSQRPHRRSSHRRQPR